jgi:hypothetical protein
MTHYERLPRRPEEILIRKPRFLGEQDGPDERLLKDEFTRMFHNSGVVCRAYLARMVDLSDEKQVNVVLGLRIDDSRWLASLIGQISSAFASFNANEHLDIAFLKDEEERELAQVCKPFFSRSMQG